MGFRHAAPEVGPLHAHDGMEVVYHIGAAGVTHIQGGGEEPFDDDTVLLYWPQTPHDQTCSHPGEDACVLLDVKAVDWLPKRRRYLKISRLGDAYLRRELLRFAGTPAPVSAVRRRSLDLRATALLLDLLDHAGRSPSELSHAPASRQIDLAEEYVRRNYRTLRSLKEVADHVGLSLDYLRHCFQEKHRTTLKQYLIDTRIRQAELLLRHSPLPQKQIAEDCGFNNVRYFNTSFKRATGMSPGRFRENR